MSGLKTLAEQDLGIILEDDVTGFGWPITITDPAGTEKQLVGRSSDIAQVIDPDTGQVVSGRLASISLRISSLTAQGLSIPQGIADASIRPWIVKFDDVNLNPFTFKVMQSNPDRTLGLVTCILEFYKEV